MMPQIADIPSSVAQGSSDVTRVRSDFPALGRKVGDRPLVYLDNAATTQKPATVIDSIADYYRRYNANVHRGVHRLSMEATEAYEGAREKIRAYINAGSVREVVFVRGTTEAVNLVASTAGWTEVGEGDNVVITGLEHHSNIVPWQMLCERQGATLNVVRIEDDGSVDIDSFNRTLTDRTRFVAINHVSNALGTVNPVKKMTRLAHERGIPVLLDGAQALPHGRVDVRDLDCDFYAFSGHKMFGPTGIGVLYGREKLLEKYPPYQGGGDMIRSVTFERTTYNDLPYKFEAGTPNIAGVIGLGAAVDYLAGLDWDAVRAHEHELLALATAKLAQVEGVRIIGTAAQKQGVVSFTMEEVHPHDIGTILDQEGIAIRTGHHCAQPVMDRFGIPATARASFALYNAQEEVEALVQGLGKVRKVMGL